MDSMFKLSPLGDSALLIELGRSIDPLIHERVLKLITLLEEASLPGIHEWVPAYCSVTLFYDPSVISYNRLTNHLFKLKEQMDDVTQTESQVIHIPVCYGGQMGPDLDQVARHNGLTPDEVIALHSQSYYLIYMLGFSPGFPYLGGLSPRLATPRHASPRPRVAAGSVGIANSQTGIYSIESPGGWQIIGRTPLKLYDPEQPSFLLKAGDYVRFIPISQKEYEQIEADVVQGNYQPIKQPYRREDGDISH